MTGRTPGVSLVWRARGVNKRAAVEPCGVAGRAGARVGWRGSGRGRGSTIPRERGVDIGGRRGENPADMKEIGTQIATLFLT